jgi:hypothetical protein
MHCDSTRAKRQLQRRNEEEKLVKLLQQASHEKSWTVQFAYGLAQEFQRLLRGAREEVKCEIDEALKQEQMRYKDATEGAWLEEREEYYKALSESLYIQRRAGLLETLFVWWTDVLRENKAWRSVICLGREKKPPRSQAGSVPPKF